MSDNEERVQCGLHVMISHCDQFSSEGDNEPGFDSLVDLLANLMHWADDSGVDFSEAYKLAKVSYVKEKNNALS